MVKVMQEGENLEAGDDDDGEEEDLAASVARWMSEQDNFENFRADSLAEVVFILCVWPFFWGEVVPLDFDVLLKLCCK